MSRTTKLNNFMVKPFVLTEAKTLTHSSSGKTYFLDAAAGFEVTLPTPRGGINFEFIVKTAPTASDYVISAKSDAKVIIGRAITSNVKVGTDATREESGSSQIMFVVPDAKVGDSVELISDGTYWYVNAFASNYAGIVIADQSKSPSASQSASPSASPSVSPSES